MSKIKEYSDMCIFRRARLRMELAAHIRRAPKDVQDFYVLMLSAQEELLNDREDTVSRLKVKNGNYRLGMKQLQKAHEALLHRFNAMKSNVENREAVRQANESILMYQNAGSGDRLG